MGNPSEKPVSPESSIDFRRGFPMDFLWFSYGFPIKTSIFLWISQRIFPALHEKRGVRSPRRGTAAGVLWDAAGGAFFFRSAQPMKKHRMYRVPSGYVNSLLLKMAIYSGITH